MSVAVSCASLPGEKRLLHVELTDRKLAAIVRKCQELPGHELFHYVAESGEISKVSSEDVNEYLREISSADFTAKDFRTWVGTSQTALELTQIGPAESATDTKKNICAAIKNLAAKLGNKPSTCRAYYIHPAVLDSYMDTSLFDTMKNVPAPAGPFDLLREERYESRTPLSKAA